ncbi:esterase/lipase family protein [Actinomadura parmotrematis]|uniref:Alpha/beta fold hydrolase n=1 Tax=Actinomadura parmotrematis TaxID=2864039 RepID=A0ABS7FZL4_9ACTN|nr:alpha/beta fold hydrolase [Actinomadura parmotrematis]MBW8485894.1 alpha/beta fold hydrolase [Actinomadura parmotrematis]
MPGRRRLPVLAALATAIAFGGIAPAEAAAAPPPKYPVGNVGKALENYLTSPGRVAGANDWNCRPSRAHPVPVVLVHATFANQGANWAVLAPTLANAGYCVFALNYGMTPLSADRAGGLGDIAASAAALDAFVDRVRAATGARKVDVVGHSQGGMMPGYYIKRLGGAAEVRRFVALAPSNHGTTILGLVELGRQLNLLGFANDVLKTVGAPGLVQQEAGSDFQKALFADGDTVPGPAYTVIETRNDIVVTPYTNAFLHGPNVTNVLVQDQCPGDFVGHVGMFNDGPVIQNVLNALGPAKRGFRAACTDYGLPV